MVRVPASLLAVLYTAIWLATFTAWVAVQLDWRPPLVAVWDGLTFGVIGAACFVACLAAGLGLVLLAPVDRLPRAFRQIPVSVAISAIGMLFIGAVRLSPASDAREILTELAQSVGMGLALGVFVGLLTSMAKPEDGVGPSGISTSVTHPALIGFLGVVAAVALTFLGVDRPRQDAKLHEFERFERGGARLQVGVMSNALDTRFGAIRITDRDASNAALFEADALREIAVLLARAERVQAATSQRVGEIRDISPSDPTRLEISGGPAVRLVISSPHGHTVAYELGLPDARRFGVAVERVSESVGR